MRGAGHLGEVGLGGSALLALLQSLSFSAHWSLSCPSEAAAGLGPAAVGRRKWTGDSVTVSFLSDSGLDPFFRVVLAALGHFSQNLWSQNGGADPCGCWLSPDPLGW